ncbi:hypothetical protein E4U55_000097 [Claviceps digitariae]|nr:hypothetical protein E4U55_000097 [Claviceps digitariae]
MGPEGEPRSQGQRSKAKKMDKWMSGDMQGTLLKRERLLTSLSWVGASIILDECSSKLGE